MSKLCRKPLAVAALSLFAALPAFAGSAKDGEVFKDWRVKCESFEADAQKREVCHIFQTVTTKEDDRVMMAIAIGTPPGANQPLALLTVPLGVFLPSGLALAVSEDKAIAQGAFQHCDPSGCRAVMPLSEEAISAMKGAEKASVLMKDGARRTVAMPVSLMGFTAGLKAIAP